VPCPSLLAFADNREMSLLIDLFIYRDISIKY
jgi:hypothetical protein